MVFYMEKPKCKICDSRHWSQDPHIFPDSIVIPAKDEVDVKAVVDSAEQQGKVCEVCGDQALKEYLVQKKVDRKTYMRLYMRKWRADEKRKKS